MRKASAPHTRRADLAAENARLQEEVRALRAQRDKAVSARDATAELLGVISKENEHLIGETREALEKQIATAEILHIISNSPADLQPTLDAIAARATALSGAAIGVVYRFDGSLIHLGTPAGLTAGEIDALRSVFPLPPSRGTATARAILTREIVHIADPTADQEYPQERFNQFGTVLSVPMLREHSLGRHYRVAQAHCGVLRGADRAGPDVRRPGRDRDREHAAVRRIAAAHRRLDPLGSGIAGTGGSAARGELLARPRYRPRHHHWPAAQLSQADEGTIYEFDETEEVFVPKNRRPSA